MSAWTKELHENAKRYLDYVNNLETSTGQVSGKCTWTNSYASDALAEIERLQAEVEKAAALAQTVTGKFWDEYVKDHCPNPADHECDCPVSRARRLGYELLRDLRPCWFTPTDGDGLVVGANLPDCGSPGPCPCSEAHAGSDGACK